MRSKTKGEILKRIREEYYPEIHGGPYDAADRFLKLYPLAGIFWDSHELGEEIRDIFTSDKNPDW